MNYLFPILSILFVFALITFYKKNNEKSFKRKSLIDRFKNSFRRKNRILEQGEMNFYNNLIQDPDKNIRISQWDKENILREKAEIHRIRLKKYGRSKINNEMLFIGPQGGIYKITPKGNKKYI